MRPLFLQHNTTILNFPAYHHFVLLSYFSCFASFSAYHHFCLSSFNLCVALPLFALLNSFQFLLYCGWNVVSYLMFYLLTYLHLLQFLSLFLCIRFYSEKYQTVIFIYGYSLVVCKISFSMISLNNCLKYLVIGEKLII